jgi:hypothetical protein
VSFAEHVVNAFWSLTMYEMPQSLLVANSINCCLLNSPMRPQFKRASGGFPTYGDEQETRRQSS